MLSSGSCVASSESSCITQTVPQPQQRRSPSLGEGSASRSQSKDFLCPVSYNLLLCMSLISWASLQTATQVYSHGKRMTRMHLQPATRVKSPVHTQQTHRKDKTLKHCAECRSQTQCSHHTSGGRGFKDAK